MRQSAGLLLFRRDADGLRLLLVHPGGPFWRNKDAGAWSIPKGEFSEDEDPLSAAIREFAEETGATVSGDFLPLGSIRIKSGKTIHVWAIEQDLEVASLRSNTFEMEWPPRSGKTIVVPEVDRAEWVTAEEAETKLHAGQIEFVWRLQRLIGND